MPRRIAPPRAATDGERVTPAWVTELVERMYGPADENSEHAVRRRAMTPAERRRDDAETNARLSKLLDNLRPSPDTFRPPVNAAPNATEAILADRGPWIEPTDQPSNVIPFPRLLRPRQTQAPDIWDTDDDHDDE